jgi:hypothetical protein
MLFSEQARNRMDMQIAEGNQTVIEAVINSYLDEDVNEMVFEHEVDISYPPDSDEFSEYLWSLVTELTGWIDLALSILSSEIKYHNHKAPRYISNIAGKTDFDLKVLSEFSYNKSDAHGVFENKIEDI